ncbi:N-formylglutamate deformylase [Glaciecola sp.]|jgi:N-formylglutamate deformylase|uniref:N-formylglutamate deformylase n=1 Tax=Glaciecola sp. MF2-115 TaxID=3384827 RepID=UPI003988C654
MKVVDIIQGDSPIILGQPHSGTYVPEHIHANLNDLGRQLLDTDWHVPKLYEGLLEGASIVRANFSRYVIDANRDPKGTNLYPGQNTTTLVPLSSFDGEPIWNKEPSAEDIQQRLNDYHRVYHQALEAEIARVKSKFGIAVLYDCHSIRSKIPFLFDDQLPDLNVGDNSGASCDPAFTSTLEKVCKNIESHSFVVNGRFKGGWTTRHYGQPQNGVHAIQMELAQRAYLASELPPFNYDVQKASGLRNVLRDILQEINTTIFRLLPENNNG